MIVSGIEVPQSAIKEALFELEESFGGFTFFQMQSALRSSGVPEPACYRGADRILQQLRKGGVVEFKGNRWVFTRRTVAEGT